MIRTYRYPLSPTKAQEAVLLGWTHACCELYNAALQHRRDAYRKQRVTIRRYDQTRELTELRAVDEAWRSIPVEISRSALARVDRAYRAFFRRVKSGAKPGFPRFRSRHRYDGFDVPVGRIEGNRVWLPKLGLVKFNKYRELSGDVRRVTVGRNARGWYVGFATDLGEAPAKAAVSSAIGIDVGLEAFATLSNGERVENPRLARAAQETIARRQRALARKRRGSNGRRRAVVLLARAHEHVRNQRLDHARKLVGALFARYDLVAFEDLAIARMVHGNLAKSIHDAGWGIFLNALTCKAEEAGKWAVPVDPRGTSQRCSGCERTVRKELSQREHRCECGLVLHRDENAARNVLALGLSAGS